MRAFNSSGDIHIVQDDAPAMIIAMTGLQDGAQRGRRFLSLGSILGRGLVAWQRCQPQDLLFPVSYSHPHSFALYPQIHLLHPASRQEKRSR